MVRSKDPAWSKKETLECEHGCTQVIEWSKHSEFVRQARVWFRTHPDHIFSEENADERSNTRQ